MISNLINNKIINQDNQETVDIQSMIRNKDLSHSNLVKKIILFNNIHFTNNNLKSSFILLNSNHKSNFTLRNNNHS